MALSESLTHGLHTTGFAGVIFHVCVYKGYHFVLLIWRCLGIKYEVDVILRTVTLFRKSCDLSLFIEQRFEFIYNLYKIFLVIYFLEES